MAYRNSVVQALGNAALTGSVTLIDVTTGGPSVYLVGVHGVVTAINGLTLADSGGDILTLAAAATAVGTPFSFSFGDGKRLSGDLVSAGAGTVSLSVEYYLGL